ncbi:splicing factor, arginine/serine-rich 19 isoform X2 [Carettochelys insculpta]|uniref:splicing factor, arginine/serine-rich 19 isoform X2 n=1 Tax=Carettochelys insculpta TaxID=44489 RepID=UPI003EB8D687
MDEEDSLLPGPEDPVGGSEERERPSDVPADREPCQPGAPCSGQVMLKALQQAVSDSLQTERPDQAAEKDAERKKMSRKKWCWSPQAKGPSRGKGAASDPTGPCGQSSTVPEALGLFPGLAEALHFLQRTCAASVQSRLLLGDQGFLGSPAVWDEQPEEVELVAEIRLGDVAAASSIFRRQRAWRVHKSASLSSASVPRWRGAGSLAPPTGSLAPPTGSLDLKWPPRTHGDTPPLSDSARTQRLPGHWAVTLGTGVPSGQQRPQAPASKDSEGQRSQPPPEKADSSSSSSSSCSSSSASSCCSQPAAPPGGGAGHPCPLRSPDLDIYDPFHPTDEDNLDGDFSCPPSPSEPAPGRQDQKYDPFDPTGSNPSSSRSSPSPEEEEEEEEEEDEEVVASRPDMSHSISRISETLAGIYDENSLSQDFPGSEPGQEEAEPSEAPVASARRPDQEPAAGADSTLPEEENASEQSDGAPEPPPEPRRRVFVVDLASKSRSEAEAHPKLEGKVSLEVVTAGNPKAPVRGEKGPKVGRLRAGRRSSLDWAAADSEIEEGEIVQPEDERYSPIRLFRSRCRPAEQRALRVPEGDDFLSLHADSDEEGDFGESQPEPRWKAAAAAADLRRKILTQRRERYRPDSPKRSGSSSGSRKKSKRSHERRPPKAKEPRTSPWPAKKKSKSRSKSKERRRSRSRRRTSRSRSRRRGSRSWSPALSAGLAALGSERRRRSRERRRGRRSRSGSRARHKEKHREGGKKKKKQQRSRSREKRPAREKEREGPAPEEPKGEERRRDNRTVVPPSIQDLNDTDLFTIKRTITVSRQDGSPAPTKREVLYDSEGLSFEGCFSDREPPEGPRGPGAKGEGGPGRKERPEEEAKAPREKERKRGYPAERPTPREKPRKRPKEAGEAGKERVREKVPRKAKAGHKAGGSGRKVKLQSKVAVLIREGVSSTTASAKEAGSIGVKFSRDKESRSPFLKPEERGPVGAEPPTGPAPKAKKGKGLKGKAGLRKAKGPGTKAKVPAEAKKKKKLKAKTGLKKSKADSCSQGAGSPPTPAPEPAASPPSPPAKPPPAPAQQELTPDSQTVDSSCKTPDVSFLPEEVAAPGESQRAPGPGEPQADSLSEPPEEPARAPPAPPAPMAWNLQGGVDCTTSGVLALTALLFKMEEANLASRAKAHELIQATNQILGHSKPSTSLASSQAPAPPAAPYLLPSSLPLMGCSSTPPTPLGSASSAPGSGTLFSTGCGSDLGKREGSSSSDGRGDTDKYLKKLHTQERAVEEVKLAIKPYYQKKEITKEEYKDILRKAVHKICHSKSGEINPVKVNNLVAAYVQRYKYFRKRGRRVDEEPGGPKDLGGLEKAPLPMPPL